MGEEKGKVQTLQSRKREINDLTHGIHPPFPNRTFPWATPASQQAAQKGERRLGIGSGRRVLWLSGWPIGTYLETAPTGGGRGVLESGDLGKARYVRSDSRCHSLASAFQKEGDAT
jgi:hypothetical protein